MSQTKVVVSLPFMVRLFVSGPSTEVSKGPVTKPTPMRFLFEVNSPLMFVSVTTMDKLLVAVPTFSLFEVPAL